MNALSTDEQFSIWKQRINTLTFNICKMVSTVQQTLEDDVLYLVLASDFE